MNLSGSFLRRRHSTRRTKPQPADKKRTFAPAGSGVLTIFPNQRVLFWSRYFGKAGEEVMPSIELGEYAFGYDRKNLLSILVTNKAKRHQNQINTELNIANEIGTEIHHKTL